MIFNQEFLGTEFIWWIGIVEDNIDPVGMGRVKVRVLGYYSDNNEELPTDKLPWAQVMQPTTSASYSGIGTSPTGLQVQSWVIGFFADGRRGQFPIVMGTLPGIHSTNNARLGGGKGSNSSAEFSPSNSGVGSSSGGQSGAPSSGGGGGGSRRTSRWISKWSNSRR